MNATGTASPSGAPSQPTPQLPTQPSNRTAAPRRHHPVRAVIIAALVLAALACAWMYAPWRGAFGLALPVAGSGAETMCGTTPGAATHYLVSAITFHASDAEGVTLQDVSLSADATNLRIVDARVARQDAAGAATLGLEQYPPTPNPTASRGTNGGWTQEDWDGLPQVAGYQVESVGLDSTQQLQIAVVIEVIDPAQGAAASGFVLRYHQYLRDYSADTGVAVRIQAPGATCQADT